MAEVTNIPNPGHTSSWYAASANVKTVRPTLEGALDADVCIIGGGFTGISAALELSERGYSVIVLEGVRVGFGASGRNGGQIVNGYSRDLETIAGRYGHDKAVKLGEMSLEGGAIIRNRIANYAIDCDLVDGGFFAAFTPKQIREMEAHKAHWEKHGHGGLEMVSRADVGHYVKTDRYAGGMIDRFGGHIHPLNLVQGEAAAAESLGARIFENSRVIAVEQGVNPIVRTATGSVKAKYVLVCGNAYLGTLLPEIGERMMPVSSQVMATEPLDADLIEELLPANYCVEDANYILDYYRRTSDNRLLYGGGIGYGGSDPDGCDPAEYAEDLSATGKDEDRLCLERQFCADAHAHPAYGQAVRQYLFFAWRQRPWRDDHPFARQDIGRGRCRPRRTFRCLELAAELSVPRG